MALLWIDGFENYGTTEGSAPSPTGVMARKYTVNGESTLDIEAGRDGGKSMQVGSSTVWLQTPGLTTERTLVVGVAFKIANVTSFGTLVEMHNLDGTGFNVYFNIGELQARRASTVMKSTTGLNLVAGVWYFLEYKCFCDNTTGSYEIRIDGVNVLSDTNVDTQNTTAFNYHVRVRLRTGSSAENTFDEWYILDTSGSTHKHFV